MCALLLTLAVIWQFFSGTLVIAPITRKQDPAAYWLVILGEAGLLVYSTIVAIRP